MTDPKRTYRLQDSLPTPEPSVSCNGDQERRKSILVIEDEEDLNYALSCRLRTAGFHVVSSFDALSGMQQTGYHKPDLVLIDLVQPNIRNSDFVGGFLELERIRHVPVVLLTPAQDTEMRRDSEQLGIAAILEKPVAHQAVVDCALKLLNAAG